MQKDQINLPAPPDPHVMVDFFDEKVEVYFIEDLLAFAREAVEKDRVERARGEV